MKTISISITIVFLAIVNPFTVISVDAQELYQTIKGRVVDKETQISLPGATISVLGAEPMLGTITDNDGYFRLKEVPLGRYSIEARFVGYCPFQVTELLVSSGKEIYLNIELSESVEKIDEVVVKTRKDNALNSMATLSARTFSVEEAGRYAGGFDDPARMASAFAGIATGSIQDNSIVIRGNAPKGILWQLEGVPIPNPNHFAGAFSAGGGLVTIFSSHIMSNSDFFTGAFPAEYGNALAGVFDMKFRTGNNETREYWFQAGLLGIDIGSEGPFVKGKKASYLFNYRYSTYGLLRPLMPRGAGLPAYQDLSFKLNFPTKKAGIFTWWGIGATDNLLKYEETNMDEWEMIEHAQREETDMKPAATGLTHRYILSDNSYINTTIAATNYSGGHDLKQLDNKMVLQNMQLIDIRQKNLIAHSFLNHKFNARHFNRTGIIFTKMFYNIDLKSSKVPGIPMEEYVNDSGNSGLMQAYTESKFNLSSSISVNVGLHTQYFFLNGNYSVEPRAGIRWSFTKDHALSFAFGKHSQLEDLKIYLSKQGDEQPNKNLDFSNAYHFVLGYDWRITDNMRFKVEPYFQYLFKIPVIADSSYSMINFHQQWFFNDKLVNEGAGRNVGIDFTFERFLNKGFYWLATASFFDAKYIGGDGIKRNSAYDRGFVSNLIFGKEFYFNTGHGKQRILGINGKLTYMGGERLNPVLEQESLAAKEIIYDYIHAYERKADPNVLVNVGLSLRNNKERFSSVWSLQILNLLQSPTSNFDYYNIKTNKLDVSTTSVMVPNLSYKIEF